MGRKAAMSNAAVRLATTMVIGALLALFVVSTAWALGRGDGVEVSWKGSWYKAHILDVNGPKYKIHYDGYESSWDEWVGPERIRAMVAWRAGELVEVLWKGTWYKASILDVKSGKHRIHYDGYEASWDEWVGGERIRTRR